MAKRDKKTAAPKLKQKEQTATVADVRKRNSASATSEGTQVNCFNEVYSYAGKWYGPGVVTIKDAEAATMVQKSVDRVEGQKQEAEQARKDGVAHTPATSTTHHWTRGDNVAAPVAAAPVQFGDEEDTEDDDTDDELEHMRAAAAQAASGTDEDAEEDDTEGDGDEESDNEE